MILHVQDALGIARPEVPGYRPFRLCCKEMCCGKWLVDLFHPDVPCVFPRLKKCYVSSIRRELGSGDLRIAKEHVPIDQRRLPVCRLLLSEPDAGEQNAAKEAQYELVHILGSFQVDRLKTAARQNGGQRHSLPSGEGPQVQTALRCKLKAAPTIKRFASSRRAIKQPLQQEAGLLLGL